MLADPPPPISHRSSPSDRTVAIVVCGCVALAVAALFLHGRGGVGEIPGFLLSFDSVALVSYLGTGAILLGQAAARDRRGLITLGTSYLFASLIILGHLIAVAGGRPVKPGRFAWDLPHYLWVIWHAAIAIGVLLYALEIPAAPRLSPRIWSNAFGAAGVAAMLMAVPPLASTQLPIQLWTAWFANADSIGNLLMNWAVLALSVAALAMVAWRRGRTSNLGLWLSVAMLASTLDVGVTGFSGDVYSAGWYIGRLLNLAASLIVLLMLMHEMIALYNDTIAANLDLRNQATTDGLTGLANRRAFDQAIEIEVRRARREAIELSLLIVDLDHFKQINDHFGHPTGDAYLITVSHALRNVINRPADMVARIGGEEFAVLLPCTDIRGAAHIAEALRLKIEELDLPAPKASLGHLSASIGAATLTAGAHAAAVSSLIAAADSAMYAAKARGRNGVAVSPLIIASLPPGTARQGIPVTAGLGG